MTPKELAQKLVAAAKAVQDDSSMCMPVHRPTVKFEALGGWSFGLNAHEHPNSNRLTVWHYQLSSKRLQSTVVTAEDLQLLIETVRAIVFETGYPDQQALPESLDERLLLRLWHSDGSAVDTEVIEGTKKILVKARTGELTAAPKPEAGRNEICPCGSGKKFKKCHGASN